VEPPFPDADSLFSQRRANVWELFCLSLSFLSFLRVVLPLPSLSAGCLGAVAQLFLLESDPSPEPFGIPAVAPPKFALDLRESRVTEQSCLQFLPAPPGLSLGFPFPPPAPSAPPLKTAARVADATSRVFCLFDTSFFLHPYPPFGVRLRSFFPVDVRVAGARLVLLGMVDWQTDFFLLFLGGGLREDPPFFPLAEALPSFCSLKFPLGVETIVRRREECSDASPLGQKSPVPCEARSSGPSVVP